MKISYKWLKEFVDVPAEMVPAALGQHLTQVGLALEACEDHGGDSVLELDVTTNRPDCLSHVGVAREVAVIFGASHGSQLKNPTVTLQESEKRSPETFSVAIKDEDLCGRYCGRYITGVRIGPSPDWVKQRLESIGVRSINNVADITNYVMMELGQPLHAFDAQKLQGRRIVVRRAVSGETMTTLDGVERRLDPSILVIADAHVPVALAGIMGGAASEISDSTVDVFLESAYFHPHSIRKTARTLGISSEASYRFERGADIEMARFACDRAASMIQQLAGGEVQQGLLDVYPGKPRPNRIDLRRERIPALLGDAVEDSAVERILTGLKLKIQESDAGWSVDVPTFRVDLATEEDLIEEIARHYGFDRFPSTMPPSRSGGALLPHENRTRRLRDLVEAAGYSEIYTYSFGNEALERRFSPDREPVRLQNPMSEEASILRTSLVPGVLTTLQWNLNRGMRDLQIYECSRVYRGGERPSERRTLILAACGDLRAAGVHDTRHAFDFFTLKGDVEDLLHGFHVPLRVTTDNVPKYYHPGRFARIGHLATFGELHPDYAEPFKIRQRVYLAEIDVELLLASPAREQILQIPKYPAIRRDFSLLLDKGTPYDAVQRTITNAGISELDRVEPFDRMESGTFPGSKYSLSISVVYQSAERTLTDVEVEGFDRTILQALEEKLGAHLRK